MFHKSKKSKDGLTNKCKNCAKQYRIDNAEHLKELDKRYRETHKDEIKEWRRKNYQKLKGDKKERYEELAAERNAMKRPCAKCGESRLYVIDFHHIDPNKKNCEIGTIIARYSLDTLKEELPKCVCICKNCHSDFHHLYGAKPISPVESLTEYLGRSPHEV